MGAFPQPKWITVVDGRKIVGYSGVSEAQSGELPEVLVIGRQINFVLIKLLSLITLSEV